MQQKIRQLLSKRYPAVAWTILIFILMAIPGKMLPNEETTFIPNFDKLIHATLFGGFVFLWSYLNWSANGKKIIPYKIILGFVVLASLYGIATELMQKYIIPNRDYSIFDIIADMCGAIIGMLITIFIMRKRSADI